MLVLSRHTGQRLFIGDKVIVEVVGINKGRVQLGISAPRELPVHREEIKKAIDAARAAKDMPAAPCVS